MVTCQEMRAIEERAFARGVEAGDLMEQAGEGIARAIQQFCPRPGSALVVPGKGNNGGDALVAARILAGNGWRIYLQEVYPEQEWQPLPRENLTRLRGVCDLGSPADWERSSGAERVVLDGLLGIGSQPGLRDPIAGACRSINDRADRCHATVFAMDLPTGLNADTGETDEDTVRVDVTVTIGSVKKGLVRDSATGYVGRLTLVRLTDLECPSDSKERILEPGLLRRWLPRRRFDSHKGTFGRVGIVAGSPGFTGAAVLSSAAAARAGAGLITLYARPEVYEILAATVPPEVMVRPVNDWTEALQDRLDALAIGPGCGRQHDKEILTIVRSAPCALVCDADALNAISEHGPDALVAASGPRVLTPHPGEMERLTARQERSRKDWAEAFLQEVPGTLLLKGARSLIVSPEHPVYYNTTGHSGMGTGGMGDVLTGVITALLGQALLPAHAAGLGAWLCGRAAEIRVSRWDDSAESLVASGVVDSLGAAFTDLRDSVF